MPDTNDTEVVETEAVEPEVEEVPAEEPVVEPEVTEVDPEVESEVTGGPEQPVVESYLSDEEKAVQELQERQAEELAPGQTLPWVAETPSVVFDQIRAEAAAEDTETA